MLFRFLPAIRQEIEGRIVFQLIADRRLPFMSRIDFRVRGKLGQFAETRNDEILVATWEIGSANGKMKQGVAAEKGFFVLKVEAAAPFSVKWGRDDFDEARSKPDLILIGKKIWIDEVQIKIAVEAVFAIV